MKAFRRAAVTVLIAAAGVVAAFGAVAQSNYRDFKEDGNDTNLNKKPDLVPEVIRGIRDFYSDPAKVDQSVRINFPMLREDQVPIMAQYMKSFLTDEAVLVHLGEAMKPAIDAKFTMEQMRDYFMELGVGLQVKGIRRLENHDIEFFLLMSMDMMKSVPAEYCKKTVTNELSTRQLRQMEMAWLSQLDIQATKRVVDFYRRSAMAEVLDKPSVRNNSKEQAALAESALTKAAQTRWSNLPDPALAYRAYGDLHKADPQEVCVATLEYLKAHLDLKEPIKSWALVRLAKEAAR